jgi:hypothetical protein
MVEIAISFLISQVSIARSNASASVKRIGALACTNLLATFLSCKKTDFTCTETRSAVRDDECMRDLNEEVDHESGCLALLATQKLESPACLAGSQQPPVAIVD